MTTVNKRIIKIPKIVIIKLIKWLTFIVLCCSKNGSKKLHSYFILSTLIIVKFLVIKNNGTINGKYKTK